MSEPTSISANRFLVTCSSPSNSALPHSHNTHTATAHGLTPLTHHLSYTVTERRIAIRMTFSRHVVIGRMRLYASQSGGQTATECLLVDVYFVIYCAIRLCCLRSEHKQFVLVLVMSSESKFFKFCAHFLQKAMFRR